MSTLIHTSIISSNKFFRLGMERMVEGWNRFVAGRVIGKRTSTHDLAIGNLPNLLVVDLDPETSWPLDRAMVIHQAFPQIKLVGVLKNYQAQTMYPYVRAGIRSFVAKDASEAAIKHCILGCLDYGFYCPPEFAQALAEELVRPRLKSQEDDECTLTEKELKTLELICQGGTNSSVASALNISPRTVEGHKMRIRQKLDASTLVNAAIKAVQFGIIKVGFQR